LPYRKAAIRPYEPQDEPVLFGLARMSLGRQPGWSDERTLRVLEGDTVFVAELDGAPAGFVAVGAAAEAVRIDELFVVPEHEGEELEWQLVEFAEGYAISRESPKLEAVVEGDDDRAREFFQRYGFSSTRTGVLELTLPQQ
jgi:ribosomal protein S18 acetylase RimI-like enzyme